MNILIIGGTGFISGRLVEKLILSGHKVVSYTRGLTAKKLSANPNLIYETGDRNDEMKLRKVLSTHKIDVVYDMIAYHPDDSELMVKIFKGKIHRFIHCSTISVYMVSEDVQCPVSEEQDKLKLMKYSDRNPFGMSYGINKRKCEDVLWKAHRNNFRVSMLRPTFVSGPEDPSRRDWFWIERILDGKPLLVPGTGNFKFQQVFIDDTAQAFHDLIYYESSIGHAYNVASEEIYTLNEYLYRLSKLLNKNPELVYIDQEEFDKLSFSSYPGADVFPFNTRRDAYFSLNKIRKDLKYHSTNFSKWMPKTIEWYLNNKKHSAGYENREDELKIIRKLKSGMTRKKETV